MISLGRIAYNACSALTTHAPEHLFRPRTGTDVYRKEQFMICQ